MSKKVITAIAGLGLTAGLLGLVGTPAGAQVGTASKPTAATAAPKPPQGARAEVQVSPNPAKRGQEVTITGHCGGAKALKAVVTGLDTKHSMLQNVRIIEDNPKGFVAKATLSPEVGYGVSPVLVNCAGEKGVSGPEAGVTLLVTQG